MRSSSSFSFIPTQKGDCQAGLKCVLTKRLIVSGTVYPVKQCMPEGVDIDVETVDLDNQSDNVSRVKRFLFNVRILNHIFPFVLIFNASRILRI